MATQRHNILCLCVAIPSELQPKRTLNHPRAAADNSSRCADRGGYRTPHGRRDPAEVRIALIVLRIGKIRVIEQIEELSAELQTDPFSKCKGVPRCEVIMLQARSVVRVAAG